MNFARVLCILALALCLHSSILAYDISPGRQIILDRGLQLQSLGFVDSTPLAPSSYTSWAGANFTTFSSWYDTNSEKKLAWTMPWSRWMRTDGTNPLTSNEINQHLGELVNLQYGDELNQNLDGTLDPATASTMAATFASWHANYGNAFLAHTNFGANNASKSLTPAALASFMSAAQPDMIMFDAYPRQYVTLNTWYAEMQKYRQAGLAGLDGSGNKPIPYAQYLDLYRTSYAASLPDESFVRLQYFASWTFGYTFLTAFVYNKPNNSTVFPALFDADGDTTPNNVYDYTAEANRQSKNLAPALTRLVSTDMRMIAGTGHALPSGIPAFTGTSFANSFITSITPIASPGGPTSSTYNDILIGFFEPLFADNSAYPFADGEHFMITNGASSGSAAGKSQWYRLGFDFGGFGYDSLQLLNRDTGLIETIPLTHLSGSLYMLEWNLQGGTGDLFRFSSIAPEPACGSLLLVLPLLARRRKCCLR